MSVIKVGINGFGRIGRLAMRVIAEHPGMSCVAINDPAGDASTQAHLMNFDSVHGRWSREMRAHDNALWLDGERIAFSQNTAVADTDWSGCDLVLECSGKVKTVAKLTAYLDQGVQRVVVSAPVKEPGARNIVMGVNHHDCDPSDRILTAASCTTNCIAPAIKVIQETFGIKHASITTIHSLTNTQTIIDAAHKDLRRARSCGTSLIPTSTGSATAIVEIFPELAGRIDGIAIRVPLTNASITDCAIELHEPTTIEAVNAALKHASENELSGVLGFETRPLVSVDYQTDPRSSIVDAPSTNVINGTQVKLMLWYDNEWGYANRTVELAHWAMTQNA